MPERIAFVAAMEREVKPLVRGWKQRRLEHAGRRYGIFENGNAVVICGGIGLQTARRATEAVIQEIKPMRVVSVGFAGALDPALNIGEIVEPGIVINANDGVRTHAGSGKHSLVTTATVAGREQKRKLREAYGAALVDMEAAAVAQGAEARGIEFSALKVISDGAEFAMPDMQHFITSDGRLRQTAFAVHLALRPWIWRTAIELARNSARASRSLSAAILDYLQRQTVGAEQRV